MASPGPPPSRPSARLLTSLSAAGSALFSAGLFAAYWMFGSDLALAQGADSLLDVAGAVVLAWAVRVAASPRDENHPMGHSRAEPLGALAIAALATVLAFEVGSSAVATLLSGERPLTSFVLLGLFVGKVVFRGAVFLAARGRQGPALSALTVDARNDLLVGAVAVVGFFAARWTLPVLDAWLTLPLAAYIAWSGFDLARENIALLMGEAASPARQAELLELVERTDGVLGAHDLVAHHLGTELSVHVHVMVRGDLTVREAHDRGERVRQRLEKEDDVVHCSVHIDPEQPPDD